MNTETHTQARVIPTSYPTSYVKYDLSTGYVSKKLLLAPWDKEGPEGARWSTLEDAASKKMEPASAVCNSPAQQICIDICKSNEMHGKEGD